MCRRPRLSGLRGTLLSRRARGGVITCNGKTVLVVKHCECVLLSLIYTDLESEQAHGLLAGSRFVDHVLRFGGYVGDLGVSIRLRGGRVVGPVVRFICS